jgi:hypothetical protein
MGWRVRRRTSVSQGGRWRTVSVDWLDCSEWLVGSGYKVGGRGKPRAGRG